MKMLTDLEGFTLKEMKEKNGNANIVVLFNSNGNFAWCGSDVLRLVQISKNEFISVSALFEDLFSFEHFRCNDDIGYETLFKKSFTNLKPYKDMQIDNDTFILESEDSTALYNCSNRTLFASYQLKVVKTDIKDKMGVIYLEGEEKVNVGETTDILTMLINSKSLETTGFYSSLQDRYIELKKNNDGFTDKAYGLLYAETEALEVIPYLEKLEARRVLEADMVKKDVRNLLVKKINNSERK